MLRVTNYLGIAVQSTLLLAMSCQMPGGAEVANCPKVEPHSGSPNMPVLPEGITALAISRDGMRVAAGGYSSPRDGAIAIYDFNSGRPLARIPGYVGSVVTSMKVLAFSPDGESVLSGGSGGLSLTRVDSADSQELLAPKTGVLIDAIFSGDGSRIVATTTDFPSNSKIVHVIDAKAGLELRSLSLSGVGSGDSPLISPDGRWVIIGVNDDTFRLWDVEGAFAERKVHLRRPMTSWRFFHGGDVLFATARDGRVHLLNTLTGREIRRIDVDWNEELLLDISLATTRALTENNGGFTLWDLENGRKFRSFTIVNVDGTRPWVARLTADGRAALFGDSGGRVVLWDVEAGSELRSFMTSNVHASGHVETSGTSRTTTQPN